MLQSWILGFVLLCAQSTNAVVLNVQDQASVKSVASSLAYSLMKWYTGNVTNTESTVGVLPPPYYWWEGGAMWGAMIDYQHYTNDTTYASTVSTALLSQVGPEYDFMVLAHNKDEANDDQAFWGFATMSAAESSLPAPSLTNSSIPSWLKLTENLWNTQVYRWNTSTCGGGLKWQIFSYQNGYNYKNSVSNGAFFQLSARLYRFTGNQTYLEWAQKSWDWTQSVGFIANPALEDDGDPTGYAVYDGAGDEPANCSEVSKIQWSYTAGMYMYGAAVLYNTSSNATTRDLWGSRVSAILRNTEIMFFSRFANATDIMVESACETINTCNNDQWSFKAYLSRFMWKTTKMAPFTVPVINTLLRASAQAAAVSCTAGDTGDGGKGGSGIICGSKWYKGGYDGRTGPGEMLSAIETIQGLLTNDTSAPAIAAVSTTSRTSSSATATATVASSSSKAWAVRAVQTISPILIVSGLQMGQAALALL